MIQKQLKDQTLVTLTNSQKKRLFEKRYDEGYDLHDPEYEAWLSLKHPTQSKSDVSPSGVIARC